jgi:hypothetical protein
MMMKGYRDGASMRKWAVVGRVALLEGGQRQLLVEGRSLCRVVTGRRLVRSEFVIRKCRQVGIHFLDRTVSVDCY